MIGQLKETWRQLRRSEPGERFQDYHRQRRERVDGGKALSLAVGMGLTLIGLFLLTVPGPGIPFLFVGGGLLAREWLWVARLLDAGEVRVRGVISWVARLWDRSPGWARVLMVLGAVVIAGGFSLGAYQITLGGD